MRPKYKSFASVFGITGANDTMNQHAGVQNGLEDGAMGPAHFRHHVAEGAGLGKQADQVIQPFKPNGGGGAGAALALEVVTTDTGTGAEHMPVWRGKSGQLYQLLPQKMEKLYFDDKVIVLASRQDGEEKALWVGNVSDIVCEPGKREIYKRAANEATMAYKIVSHFPASDMAGTIWDVEQGALA